MLQIQGLKKEYPGFSLDVSMEVKPGRITGLIGQNGAGKSTVFKSILQLIHIDGGSISLLGRDALQMKAGDRQLIGTVLADAGFSGFITADDVRRILRAIYPRFDEKLFCDKCRTFNLDTKKKIKDLSTGMRARLKVIAAMSHDARFLLMDEPTAGLDVVARDEVLSMIRDYLEEDEDRAVLISSHISSDLERLCDDFYMIHNGKIILHEETDRLLAEYGIIKVTEEEYQKLDKSYILKKQKEAFGCSCLTDQMAFYRENYPGLVIEKSGLDELIMLMVRGENL